MRKLFIIFILLVGIVLGVGFAILLLIAIGLFTGCFFLASLFMRRKDRNKKESPKAFDLKNLGTYIYN
jgi:hypothetical protein